MTALPRPRPLAVAFDEIADRLKDSAPILLGLDFDGTLTPLRDRPDAVELDESTRAILAGLASNPRVVVMIVSGRSIADVSARVGLSDLAIAGNHGLEIEGKGLSFIEPAALSSSNRLGELAAVLQTRLAHIFGVLVERKGLTLGIHYRNVALNHWDEVSRVVREAAESEPTLFVLRSGKLVWEIRPAVDWHKGRAILWTLDRLNLSNPLIFYFGDDLTDEDAFGFLPQSYTVKVGDPSSPTLARYFVEDPTAVREFLARLSTQISF